MINAFYFLAEGWFVGNELTLIVLNLLIWNEKIENYSFIERDRDY
jgi:hypothetical protein